MISFQTRTAAAASTMLLLALLLFVAGAVWISQPLPNETGIAGGKRASIVKIESDIDQAKKMTDEAQAAIEPMLWSGPPEQVGPLALSAVTKLAQTYHLKVIAFRPQKGVEVDGLTQLPYSVAVQGTYPEAVKFVKDLETSKAKLAVSLVQIASSDAATDQVTGTINLVAYLRSGGSPKAAPKGGTDAQKS